MAPRAHNSRQWGIGAVVAVLMLALSGCTGGVPDLPLIDDDPTQPSRFDLVPVPVPDDLSTEQAASAWSRVSPTEELPGVLAAEVELPGRRSEVRLWSISPSGDVEPATPPAIEQPVRSVTVDGSTERTLLNVTVTEDGRPRERFFHSADRVSWTEIEVPADLATQHLRLLGVVGSTGYLRSEDTDLMRGLWQVTDDGQFLARALPEVPAERQSVEWGLAGDGDALLLLRSDQDEAGKDYETTYQSEDGGQTWSEPTDQPELAAAEVGWLTRAGDRFVLSGSTKDGDGDVAAAYSSTDGSTWKRETVPQPDQVGFLPPGSTGLIGGSEVVDGVVTAMMRTDTRSLRWVTRAADGRWRLEPGEPEPFDATSVQGLAWTDGTGPAVVAAVGGDLLLIRPDDVERLVPGARLPRLADVTALGETTAVSVTTPFFEAEERGGWRQGSDTGSALYVDGAVRYGGWPIPLLEDLKPIGADGTEDTTVVVGNGYDDDGWFTRGAVRVDGEWVATEGLGSRADTYEQATAVKRGEAGWVVATTRGLSTDWDSRSARLYTSTDGQSWERAPGSSWRAGSSGSSISALCTDRDGAVLAYGHVEEDDRTKASIWRLDDEEWKRTDLDLAEDAWFDGCAEAADGSVVISGWARGRQSLWSTEDGVTGLSLIDQVDERVRRGSVVAVEGGLVAGGYWRGPQYEGPVIWLSRDGREWIAEPVPTQTADTDVDVHAVGRELVVVGTSPGSTQAWRIPDIATVMADL